MRGEVKLTGVVGWGERSKPTKIWLKRQDGSTYPLMKFTLVRNDPRYEPVKNEKTGRTDFVTQKFTVYLPSNGLGLSTFRNLYQGRYVEVTGTFGAESFAVAHTPESDAIPRQKNKKVKTFDIGGIKVDSIPMECIYASDVEFLDKPIEKQFAHLLTLMKEHKLLKDVKEENGKIISATINATTAEVNFAIKKFREKSVNDAPRPGQEKQEAHAPEAHESHEEYSQFPDDTGF